MILGVGVDIVEITRIKHIVGKNPLFLDRILENSEIEYLESRNLRTEFIAGRFAAKEAVAKALGTGFREFGFKDIVIKNTSLGKPIVVLKGKAKEIAEQYGNYNIHLSISHSRENAVAYAVLEGDKNENWNC